MRARRILQLGLRAGQRHQTLDDLTAMAARLFHAPIALITLIDGDRQIFLSKFGLDAAGTGRAESFCGHGIHSPAPLAVDDAFDDPRFAGNPLVEDSPYVRAYLGVPLLSGAGQSAIGSLCLIDRQPRVWTPEEEERLVALSGLVENYLEGLTYRRVWDDSPLALVVLDREGRCLRVNQAFGQLTGGPLEMVVHRPVGEFALPADRRVLASMLDSTFRRPDRLVRREVRFRHMNGDVSLCCTSMSRLTDLDDQVVCVLRDISQEGRGASNSEGAEELRREVSEPFAEVRALSGALAASDPASEAHVSALNAGLERLYARIESRLDDLGARLGAEEELRASERQVRAVMEHAIGPILVLDDEGCIVDANANALKELGWGYEHLVGASMRVVKPDFNAAEYRRRFAVGAQRARDGQPQPDELATFVCRDGSELGVELHGLVMGWNGPERLVLIARNLNAAQRREADLRKERENLLATLERRTVLLAEQQRTQADIKASLANRETLLKEIHHRVKNNLQIVSSLLSLQKEQVPSEEARSMIGECALRVRSIAMIHEQLYGTTSLDRINLAAYTREIVDSLRFALAPEVRVRIVAAEVEMAVENAVPFGLILNELITNSLKYGVPATTPDDEAFDLSIELTEVNRQLNLIVRDRGRGLPPGFDVAKGRGLGLQIVRGLARQLKGRITARTEGGAVFELTCRL